MNPVIVVLGIVALAFALLALTQRMRVSDLEAKVAELEAALADRLPAPPPDPEPEVDEQEEDDEEEPDEPEEEDEPEEAAQEEPQEEPAAEGQDPDEEELEELDEIDEIEPPPPVEAAPVVEPIAPASVVQSGPDPLRLAALEQVQQAFETCRYLDFDAIVRKPSTYRVTVPITAASGPALRHLEDGMFPCLEEVRIEGTRAILHIDTSKGPP